MPYSRGEAIVSLVFIFLFILVMVVFIIIILFFVQKKQKGFISDLNIVKANYEKELFKAQLEIQEQTFQDISREIHDNVGQLLSLAKLSLGTVDLDLKTEAKESIGEISDIVEKALDDLRHLSRNLNSEVISKGGLKKSIEMQVGYIQRRGGLNVNLQVDGEPVLLNEKKEIILFRILQEAINNIIRHATAKDICINLCYLKDLLSMQVRDNGTGFQLNELPLVGKSINGLHNMQHRAKLIEAELLIDSKPGEGTCITVNTPY
jgi:two-component system, NarL family, sensor kinase